MIHISEADATNDFSSLLARVRAGAEVVIERNSEPVAIVHAVRPERRRISDCIALLPEGSTATIDPEFARDVEVAIQTHRESIDPLAWE